MEKSWNCVFEFLWEPFLEPILQKCVMFSIHNINFSKIKTHTKTDTLNFSLSSKVCHFKEQCLKIPQNSSLKFVRENFICIKDH